MAKNLQEMFDHLNPIHHFDLPPDSNGKQLRVNKLTKLELANKFVEKVGKPEVDQELEASYVSNLNKVLIHLKEQLREIQDQAALEQNRQQHNIENNNHSGGLKLDLEFSKQLSDKEKYVERQVLNIERRLKKVNYKSLETKKI